MEKSILMSTNKPSISSVVLEIAPCILRKNSEIPPFACKNFHQCIKHCISLVLGLRMASTSGFTSVSISSTHHQKATQAL